MNIKTLTLLEGTGCYLYNGRMVIAVHAIACGNIGIYDDKGLFYSFTTLKVDGFTIIK